MIDGVELVVLDELHQVRELHRDRAVRRQQLFHSGHEVVEIGDVSQDVVADQEIGGPAPASEVHGDGSAEELDVRGDATGFGNLRHVGGRLDSQYVEAASHKVLEQVSVVRRNFHNPAVLAQAEALNRRVGIGRAHGRPSCLNTTRNTRIPRRSPRAEQPHRAAPAGTAGRSTHEEGRTARARSTDPAGHITRTAATSRDRRTCPRGAPRRSGKNVTRPCYRSKALLAAAPRS